MTNLIIYNEVKCKKFVNERWNICICYCKCNMNMIPLNIGAEYCDVVKDLRENKYISFILHSGT